MIFHLLLFALVSGSLALQNGNVAIEIAPRGITRVTIPSDIPKIIHQSWKTSSLPEAFQVWSQTWKECLPGWEYKLHTDDANRDIFKTDFPDLLATFDNYPASVYRADASRLAYMAKEGGLYVDLDIECLKDPSAVLNSADSLILACEGCHQISNAFMMGGESAKGFFRELLQKLPQAASKEHTSPLAQTGPIFWTKYASPMLSGSWRTAYGSMNHLTYQVDGHQLGATVLDDLLVFGAPWNNSAMKTASLNRSWVLQHFPRSFAYSHWTASWQGEPLPHVPQITATQMSHAEQCQCLLSAITGGEESQIGCQSHVHQLLGREACSGRACFVKLNFEYRDSCI